MPSQLVGIVELASPAPQLTFPIN